MTIEEFLQLVTRGGAITSSNECTPEEISLAQAEDRFFVDADGYGYVYDSFE